MKEFLLLLVVLAPLSLLVHFHWSVGRQIQESHDWLEAFKADNARREKEFRRKMRRRFRL